MKDLLIIDLSCKPIMSITDKAEVYYCGFFVHKLEGHSVGEHGERIVLSALLNAHLRDCSTSVCV